MTIRKESKQYIRQQRKIDADLVKRPNEILKRTTDDGNLKLTFKSPAYYEKDIVITKNAMLSTIPLIKTYASLETSESFILDLEGQEIITYNLTQNTTITDVINYNNGMSYKIYIKQDEVGGKSFIFDETISNITLFDNFQIDQTPNSITQIKIDVVEDTLYVQSYVKYKKVEYSDYGSLSFTINTTLGQNAGPSFQLPIKQNYLDITNNINYEFNYDFIVDWGDGQSDHITSVDDISKNHVYATDGTYEIKISGLCEGFGNLALNLSDIVNGYFDMNEVMTRVTTMDFEKIISVDYMDNIGLIDAGFMFGFYMPLNINNINTTNWVVSNVTNMSGMFFGCSSLTTLDVSNWDVSNVSDMTSMFDNCSSLTTLDVSNWDVSNVTNMWSMFRFCSSLTTLDVSNWGVSNVTDMNNMFDYCASLTTLDVSNWDVSNVTHMIDMFNHCTSLTTLDVSNWDVSNVSDMTSMFSNTPLDTASYDALLIGWSGLPSLQSNVNFNADLAKYSSGEAATAREILTSAPNKWKIIDAGQVVVLN